MHSHDTGRYIQPYGYAIDTPNLQKFAEEGMLFRKAFTVSPTCSPSRAALLTGEMPHSNGMLGLAHRGFSLYNYNHHIVDILKSLGYKTTLAGIQHIAEKIDDRTEGWQRIGYDNFLGNHEVAEEKAIEYIATKPEEPFFMSVGFFETHREFPEKHPFDNAAYCLPPYPLPDTPENREDMACFKECARSLDRKMGAVLDALSKSGMADNTLVIITTDHGIAFPRMKCNLEDSGTGVMLMLRGPNIGKGKVIDGMITNMDIYPTICELLEIEKPEWLQGKSLLPMINREKDELHSAIFAEVNYHVAFEPMRSVRTKEWKYIRRYDKQNHPILSNCDVGFSKTTWMDHGWQNSQPKEEALFNLIFDPNEVNNLAGDPDYETILIEMKSRLRKEMQRTGDPLLKGDVPLPSTALVNDRDDLDPSENTLPVGTR